MQLVLLRHADAEPEVGGPLGDFGRALTSVGRVQARDTARWLAARVVQGSRWIWSSPLLRAVQTAEILASRWEEARVGIDDALASGHSVERQLQFVHELSALGASAVVGHEPSMGELAAALLGLPAFPVPFEKGAALILRRGGDRFELVAYRAPFREPSSSLP